MSILLSRNRLNGQIEVKQGDDTDAEAEFKGKGDESADDGADACFAARFEGAAGTEFTDDCADHWADDQPEQWRRQKKSDKGTDECTKGTFPGGAEFACAPDPHDEIGDLADQGNDTGKDYDFPGHGGIAHPELMKDDTRPYDQAAWHYRK